MRSTCDVLIYIDIPLVLASTIKLYLSDNGVVLTEGNEKGFLEPKFFLYVEQIRRGRDTGGGWGKGKGVAVPSKREVIPGWEMERERAWLGYLEEEVRTTGTEVPATSALVAGSNPDSKDSKVSGLETKLGEVDIGK